MTVLRGGLGPDEIAASRYHYVSFEVPPAAAAVSVHLDLKPPDAVVDLGVFDPEGFRGYSGGARDRFVITPDVATPGYLPGELVAGEWRVLLGPYRVPPNGVTYSLTISTAPAHPEPVPPAPASPPRPPQRALPGTNGRTWVACDLHVHSIHSDGGLTPEGVAARARARGLDLVALTDHNTTSHHRTLSAAGSRYGVQLLPGQEVTTVDGHLNCLGDIGWIDFREPQGLWVEAAVERGGIASISHPVLEGMEWRLGRCGAALVEAWHGTWDLRSTASLDWWRQHGGTPVGGSDFHDAAGARRLGCPTTWLEIEDDGGALGALWAGRVALSCDPFGPVIVRRDDEIEVVDGEGARLVTPAGRIDTVSSERYRVRCEPDSGPYRLLAGDGRMLALTP